MKKIIYIFTFSTLMSCTSSNNSNKELNPQDIPTETTSDEEENNGEKFDMTNPALMMGSDLGTIFKTYYKIGDFKKMVQYTSKATIEKYGSDSLEKIYRKLNLGFDMKLKSITTEEETKILHYECQTFATKSIRRMHVIIENDTARIIPLHLEKGDVFE
jgi:hypothetical protein